MTKSQDTNIETFGEFFRQKRIDSGFTLRSFCERFGFDPAFISRIERGLLTPYGDKEKLKGLAKALKLNEGSEEWVTFFDLAFLSNGKIPTDILQKKNAMQYFPLLFRTARGQRLSKEKLQELVDLINK